MDIKRGEIWYVDLSPTKGHELDKERPVVIINTDIVNKKSDFELRIVIPITTWQPKHDFIDWLVHIKPSPRNGLDNPSVADPYQIRCVSEERFTNKIGVLSQRYLFEIEVLLYPILELAKLED